MWECEKKKNNIYKNQTILIRNQVANRNDCELELLIFCCCYISNRETFLLFVSCVMNISSWKYASNLFGLKCIWRNETCRLFCCCCRCCRTPKISSSSWLAEMPMYLCGVDLIVLMWTSHKFKMLNLFLFFRFLGTAQVLLNHFGSQWIQMNTKRANSSLFLLLLCLFINSIESLSVWHIRKWFCIASPFREASVYRWFVSTCHSQIELYVQFSNWNCHSIFFSILMKEQSEQYEDQRRSEVLMNYNSILVLTMILIFNVMLKRWHVLSLKYFFFLF